jgi:hypothetical protein
MLNPRSLDPARPRSQCFDVGHDVLNLRRLEDFLERRHQGVAVLDPSFQRLIGDFISVHRKSSSLGNSLQARSNLFCIVVREMAEPAFLIEDLFASYRGPRRSVAGCFFGSCFCRRILCQKRSSHAQNCNPNNQIIPPHDAPSFLRLWPGQAGVSVTAIRGQRMPSQPPSTHENQDHPIFSICRSNFHSAPGTKYRCP